MPSGCGPSLRQMDLTEIPESEQGRVLDAMLALKRVLERNGWGGLDLADGIASLLADGRILLFYDPVGFAVGEREVVKARASEEGCELAYFTLDGTLVKTTVRHR